MKTFEIEGWFRYNDEKDFEIEKIVSQTAEYAIEYFKSKFPSLHFFKIIIKETLEEADETISDFIKRESKSANESVGIVKGAKWQQERSYSEEDMKKAYCNGANLDYNIMISTKEGNEILEESLKQFKNK